MVKMVDHKAAKQIPLVSQTKGLRRLPHVWLFMAVNLGYSIPVLIAYLLSFNEGGVENVLDLSTWEIIRFTLVYAFSSVAFLCGAIFARKLPFIARDRKLNDASYAQFHKGVPTGLRVGVGFLSLMLVVFKILIIPTGVYSEYIFDADLGAGPFWTISMFLSESLVIFLLAIMIAEGTIVSAYFIGGSLCLSINLLHGTRIFDVVLVFGVIFYIWIQFGFRLRGFVLTVLGLIATFAVLYLTFVSRANYKYSEDSNIMTKIISPVTYEAVFSQMSLIGFLQLDQISLFGYPIDFLTDTISWILPRFINPNKDDGGLLSQYAYLAPVGAFSGHAAGLIYFGYSLAAYYFWVGAFGSWLQRRAKKSPIYFVVFVYFCSDILFRMMRDGLIYPIKYFSNSVLLLLIGIYLFQRFGNSGLSRRSHSIVSILRRSGQTSA